MIASVSPLRGLLPVCLLALLPLSTANAQEPRLYWQGMEVTVPAVRKHLGGEAVRSVRLWSEFCLEHDYEMHLDKRGVSLLIAPVLADVKPASALIERTRESFDELLPVTARPTELPGPAKPKAAERAWRRDFAFGQSLQDRETVVLLALRGRKDYAAALDVLVDQNPFLARWAADTKRFSGFVAAAVHAMAWIRTEGGNQNLDPRNALVNGLSRLLVQRRFGTVPHWLRMGLAWQLEMQLLGVLYTHPNRPDQVVFVEGSGWLQELRRLHKRRKAFDLGPPVRWDPATWDRDAAVRAFGLSRFLVQERTEELPILLDHLSALFWEKGRTRNPAGGWLWDVSYQPSVKDQREVLERIAGEGVLEEAAAFLKRKGGLDFPPATLAAASAPR